MSEPHCWSRALQSPKLMGAPPQPARFITRGTASQGFPVMIATTMAELQIWKLSAGRVKATSASPPKKSAEFDIGVFENGPQPNPGSRTSTIIPLPSRLDPKAWTTHSTLVENDDFCACNLARASADCAKTMRVKTAAMQDNDLIFRRSIGADFCQAGKLSKFLNAHGSIGFRLWTAWICQGCFESTDRHNHFQSVILRCTRSLSSFFWEFSSGGPGWIEWQFNWRHCC